MADAFDMAWGDGGSDIPLSTGSVRFEPQPLESITPDAFDLAWAGSSTPQTSHLDNIWQGIKNSPSAAIDMVSSIPDGISNVFNSVFSPIQSANDGTTDATLRGVGSLAAGTAGALPGAAAGALAGAPLAPLTFGLSVPIGAIAGGAAGGAGGLGAFDYLNELFSNDAPTTPEEKISKFEQNLGTGLALGAAGKVAGAGLNKLSNLDDTANALDRKSLGARQSDYGKTSGVQTVETPEGNVESFTKNVLNDLVENNKLGSSRNPETMLKNLDSKAAPLADAVNNLIKTFDETKTEPVVPSFDSAMDYIKNNVPAAEVNTYLGKLGEIQTATATEGGGSLQYLQKQKQAYGTMYNPTADSISAGFTRALYNDFKQSIEKAVPGVEELNKELRKYIVARPIIERSLITKESASPASKLRDLGYTTGGVGASTVAGGILGGPGGAVVGTGLALGTRAAASPTGQALIAKGLRAASNVASPISELFSRGSLPAAQGVLESQAKPEVVKEKKSAPSKSSATSELFQPNSDDSILKRRQKMAEDLQAAGPKSDDVKKIEARIDSNPFDSAVYEFESSRNPKAKNPNSTASGGFQLLKSTAAKLGVNDVFDLKDNYEGYLKLKEENKAKFGDDPALLYASHYLGSTLLTKYLKGKDLTNDEEDIVKNFEKNTLPKFLKVYAKVASKTVEA